MNKIVGSLVLLGALGACAPAPEPSQAPIVIVLPSQDTKHQAAQRHQLQEDIDRANARLQLLEPRPAQ
jgi:hypothetical protein